MKTSTIYPEITGNRYYVRLDKEDDGEHVNTAHPPDINFDRDGTSFTIRNNFCYKKTGKKVRIGAIFP